MPAQVALAWVPGQVGHVVAIPGTARLENLKTRLGALDCHLGETGLAALDPLAQAVRGNRY